MTDFGALDRDERNLARRAFLTPFTTDRDEPLFGVSDAALFRVHAAMALRGTVTRYPTDPEVLRLVEDLSSGSAEFRRLWARHDVQASPALTKTFQHPVVGSVTVDCDSMLLPERDQHLVLYTAPVGSPAAEALAFLGAVGVTTP